MSLISSLIGNFSSRYFFINCDRIFSSYYGENNTKSAVIIIQNMFNLSLSLSLSLFLSFPFQHHNPWRTKAWRKFPAHSFLSCFSSPSADFNYFQIFNHTPQPYLPRPSFAPSSSCTFFIYCSKVRFQKYIKFYSSDITKSLENLYLPPFLFQHYTCYYSSIEIPILLEPSCTVVINFLNQSVQIVNRWFPHWQKLASISFISQR